MSELTDTLKAAKALIEMGMGSSAIEAIDTALQAMQGEAEPVYAFRRKGLDDFCTCDERRYLELKNKPNLFEVAVFYTTPQPAVPEGWKVEYPESGYGEIVITAPDGTMDIIHENTDFIVEQLCRHLLSAAKEQTE